MSAPVLILDSNLKAILDAGFEACFGGAPARYFSAPDRIEIGGNYNVRVATSDSLVQLSSIRSGVLRVSARELREEVETAHKEMKKAFSCIKATGFPVAFLCGYVNCGLQHTFGE